MNQELIQQNAIIYLSAGFDGPFILQAFSIRKLTPPIIGLQMCLTDGKVYIGAKYTSNDYPEVQDYWLVEITAKFISQTQPMFIINYFRIIKSIQVVNTYPRKLLGVPPCTLSDYFNKQIGKIYQDKLGQPNKKIKYTIGFDLPFLKNSQNKKSNQKQKLPMIQHFLLPSITTTKKKDQPKQKNPIKKQHPQKKLKISNSDPQLQQQQLSFIKKQKINGITSIQKQQELQIINHYQHQQNNTCSIQQLYQHKINWKILCRVNYLNKVQCNSGLIAYNFMLADKNGDQIKCVYFENPMDAEIEQLEVGKYYIFSQGEINLPKVTNKSDHQKQIHITFDKNSTIIPKNNVDFPLNINKFCRINTIHLKQPNTQLNVIGIIRQIKFLQQSTKNKCKFSATICDPLTGHQIDLLLFLNHHEKPPQRGIIGFLHNFQLFKQNNVCRLNSTYKSYFRQQTAFKDTLTIQLKRITQHSDWQNFHYKNFSNILFSFRTIKDLKKIINSTDDDRIYSLIDCWIADITKKKFYYACKTCKKGTDKKDSGVYYCPNCKRNVDIFYCFTFTVNFADFTSNIVIDVIGQHAQTLIQLKSIQFFQFSSQKQLNYLNELKFKNITIKIKTQKKDNHKKQNHSVWAIQYSNSINTIKEIKKKIQQRKIRIQEKW